MPDDAALSEGASPRPETGRWMEPFRALRHRAFRQFWLAQTISLTGSWMQGVAQRWLVHELTRPHSEAMLGITNALTALPVLFLAPITGTLADRFERRRILLGVQLVATAIALTLWLLTLTGWVRLWHILALALMMGCVRAFDVPTRQSFWAELVGRADLMSAITLNSAVINLSRILGPSLGGVIIETIGITNCFLFNALSFLPPILVLWTMPSWGVTNAQRTDLLASLREGIRYLRGNFVVLRLLLLVGAWSLFGGQFEVLLPVLADKVYGVGAKGYGFLFAAWGVGALFGAVFAASMEQRLRRGRLVVVGSFCAALSLASLSFVRHFSLAIPLMALVGLGMVTQNATCNTLVQSLVPDDLRGRVMGFYSLMFIGLIPLGSLFYGTVASILGAPMALLTGAACFALVALALISQGIPRLP
jgi:predicted MFS family arabinose efflux permease